MFQVRVYYQNDFTVVIVSFENQGFHISTSFRGTIWKWRWEGGGQRRREGGVWHQNRTWFSEGRKGLVHDAWLSLKVMREAWILQKGKGGGTETETESETELGLLLTHPHPHPPHPPPLCFPLFRLLNLKQDIHFSWQGCLSQLEVFNRVWVSAKCSLYAFQRHTLKGFINNSSC